MTRLAERFRPNPTRAAMPATILTQQFAPTPADLLHNYETYALEGLAGSGPVFALIATRLLAFQEAELKWQNKSDRSLFGNQELAVFERPGPNQSTRTMLGQMEVDVSLAGNSYWLRSGDRLHRLRPDRVGPIVVRTEAAGITDVPDLGGYLYQSEPGAKYQYLTVEEVVHYAPYPDPLHPWKGMSWLTPVAREVDADTYMSRHKSKFFTNAATPNLLLKVQGQLSEEAKAALRAEFTRKYESVENAYKTAIVDNGADITPLGHSFEQMAFGDVQSSGEARLAAAAGVPPQIVGFVKGLQASTYTNYTQAMRRFADLTLRPLWGHAAAALETVTSPPPGVRLWYDDRHIPFLQQDAIDDATIRREDTAAIGALIASGFTPDSAVRAVSSGDYSVLSHTGLVSVQLQVPGASPAPTVKDSTDD